MRHSTSIRGSVLPSVHLLVTLKKSATVGSARSGDRFDRSGDRSNMSDRSGDRSDRAGDRSD